MSDGKSELCEIQWAAEGTRARRVVSRSNHRATGKFPSPKNGRMMHWESMLERDAFVLLEVNPAVLSYREQPAVLTFPWGDETREHYPDVLVCTRDGETFQEIKSDDDAEDAFIQKRTAYLAAVLPAQGYQYELLTEHEIRKEPRLSNARLLLRYGYREVSAHDQELVRNVFARCGGSLPWSAIESDSLGPLMLGHVCRLILDGVLAVNIDGTPLAQCHVTIV